MMGVITPMPTSRFVVYVIKKETNNQLLVRRVRLDNFSSTY